MCASCRAHVCGRFDRSDANETAKRREKIDIRFRVVSCRGVDWKPPKALRVVRFALFMLEKF
jgi:hypothetical protein